MPDGPQRVREMMERASLGAPGFHKRNLFSEFYFGGEETEKVQRDLLE